MLTIIKITNMESNDEYMAIGTWTSMGAAPGPNPNNMTVNDIDNIESEEEEQYIEEVQNQSENKIPYKEVTVNGVEYKDKKKVCPEEQLTLIQCEFCQKFYQKTMITVEYDQGQICYHCLFWTNYSIEQRQLVDGIYGKTIVEYVMDCQDSHERETCQKNLSGCFVCDFLNRININGIICGEMLGLSVDEESLIPDNTEIDDDENFEILIDL